MHFILYNYINVNPQIWLLASCIIMHLGRRLSRRRRGETLLTVNIVSQFTATRPFLEREIGENFFNFDIPAATSGLEYFAILSQPTSIFSSLFNCVVYKIGWCACGMQGRRAILPAGKGYNKRKVLGRGCSCSCIIIIEEGVFRHLSI